MLKRLLLLAALLPLFAFAQYQPPGVQYATAFIAAVTY
jgi:hypothetical protein